MMYQPFTYELTELKPKKNIKSITKNTINWNGVVNLNTDYVLQPNEILIIETCTQVNLDQGVRLIIQGRLIIEGTNSCPVVMNNQGTGDHRGISFESQSKNKAHKIDNLTIKNSDFGVTIFSSDPTFNNLIIENADKVGIDIYDAANPYFFNVHIEQGGIDEHGGNNNNWRYGIAISVGNMSTPIFDGVYINGTLTRGFNFWGNSGGLYSNIDINNVTGSTLAAATCLWIMDSIPFFQDVELNRCDNGVWVRQFDDNIRTNAVIKDTIIKNSRFYGVIIDKNDHTNYTNYVMATFENLEVSGTGGINSNGYEFQEGVAAIEVNTSGAIFENINIHDNPVPGIIGYLVDDSLFMKDVQVKNCGKDNTYGHDSGIYIFAAFDNGPPELQNIHVSNSTGSGIHIERGATNGKNWNLHNNSKFGLFIDHATVRTNWVNVSDNHKSGAYIFDSSNVILQNLTSNSNGYQSADNIEGSGIVFHLSNNVESNNRNVTCINCTSANDAFGGIYIEDSIDLYLKNILIYEPKNDGYGIYANNEGLTQIGHINLDNVSIKMNRTGPIAEINGAAKINNLNIHGNQNNGFGLFWNGSNARTDSYLSNSSIKSEKCMNLVNLNKGGESVICDGEISISNSNINISQLEAINSQNVVIKIKDQNSILHLHKPKNIDLNFSVIETGSIIEEAYDIEIWVKNQFQNRLPFAELNINFSYFNDDMSMNTDYFGYAKMQNYIVREWSSVSEITVSSQSEELDISCSYDNVVNNTGIEKFENDIVLYCNLNLSNQAPIIIWSNPDENQIFPSKGVVEFNSTESWDLENDELNFVWTSDLDGELLDKPECNHPEINLNKSLFLANSGNSINCLSDGTHKITLKVCDDKYSCSFENKTITLTNLPIVVNLETYPTADGDGVLRIPRSTIVEFNVNGTFDPEGETMEIFLTNSYNQQTIPPNSEKRWFLSFIDSPNDEIDVTITFNDGVAGNLISKNIKIILFNERPIANFEVERVNEFSSSKIILNGSSSYDPENDEIFVQWVSNLDGILKNGSDSEALIWDGWLSSGLHEITLSVADSNPNWESSTKTIMVNVENSPPIASISSILNNVAENYRSSDLITFITNGSGDWDSSCENLRNQWKIDNYLYCNSNLSTIKSDLLTVTWSSDLDGLILLENNENSLGWTGRLSAGNHTVTLEINDGYHSSVFSSISIEVLPSSPVLMLDSPNLENDFRSNQSILFDLRNSIDYDGDSFTWTLAENSTILVSNSGIKLSQINSNEIFSIKLPRGIHNLSLILTDSNDMQSVYYLILNVLSSNPVPSITSPTAHFEWSSNTFTFEAGQKINLSAEESFDPDNDILNFRWEIKSELNSWEIVLDGIDSTNLEYNLNPGKYKLKLIIFDELGGSAEKIVNIFVESSRPVLEDFNVHPQIVTVGEKSELKITIKLIDSDNTTQNLTATIILGSQNWFIKLNDNGTNGDLIANDGIWSTVLTLTPNTEGFASIRVTAIDVDLTSDEKVIDIKVNQAERTIIQMLGGGENVLIGGFISALFISFFLAIFIRKRSLRLIEIEDYVETWDSLTIKDEKSPNDFILEDELDI